MVGVGGACGVCPARAAGHHHTVGQGAPKWVVTWRGCPLPWPLHSTLFMKFPF